MYKIILGIALIYGQEARSQQVIGNPFSPDDDMMTTFQKAVTPKKVDPLSPYLDPITEKKESKFEELLKHIEELEKEREKERKKRRPIVIGKKLLGAVLIILLMPAIMFTMQTIFNLQKNLFDQLDPQEVLYIILAESGVLVLPVYYTMVGIVKLIESER
jgi:hypothetical protein